MIVFGIWVFLRSLGHFLKPPRPSTPKDDAAANHMVKDPVCGMYMDSRLAVRLDSRRESFYFCSEECKNKYLGNPGKDTGTSSPPPM